MANSKNTFTFNNDRQVPQFFLSQFRTPN